MSRHSKDFDSLSFYVSHYDTQSTLTKEYILNYSNDETIDMYDCKLQRIFLRKTKFPLKLNQLFVGNKLNILNRILTIERYANEFTKTFLQKQKCILQLNDIKRLLELVAIPGLLLTRLEMQESDIVAEIQIDKASDLNGIEFKTIPSFPPHQFKVYEKTTLCLIKPHVLFENQLSRLLSMIVSNGFHIHAARILTLSSENAYDFFEIYKNTPDFNEIVSQVLSGPCIALQIGFADSQYKESVVNVFRDFCGPHDPAIAKELSAGSLRDVFGSSKGKNAVHCTDLETDGTLECEYFFKIIE